MTINGTNGVSASMSAGQLGMSQASDPVSKNIQNQIARVQKQLQELSANTELGAEEKMKKRQELQKQISDLNMQLRQHQIEQRREKQQEQASFDDMLGGGQQTDKANGKGQAGVPSQASMEAMISADTAMSQAKVQGSVATKMESRAGVLEAEIMLDSSRSGSSNVELKQAELEDVKEKAMDATAAQMGTLAEANRTLEEASEADGTAKDEKEEEKKAGENAQTAEAAEEAAKERSAGSADSDGTQAAAAEDLTAKIAPVVHYTPVDVRL